MFKLAIIKKRYIMGLTLFVEMGEEMVVATTAGCVSYCLENGYEVGEIYEGKISEYRGLYSTLITDQVCHQFEYHYARYCLRLRGYELLSLNHTSSVDKILSQFVDYLVAREREHHKLARKGGRPAYGFRWNDGKKEIIPDEFDIAKEMIKMRERGYSLRKIAAEMDRLGYRARNGKRFTVSTIQVILKKADLYSGGIKNDAEPGN